MESKMESKEEDERSTRKRRSTRLPHTLPPRSRKSATTRSPSRTGKRLPPMPKSRQQQHQHHQQQRATKTPTFVDAMNQRARERHQLREERRQRYLALDLHKQRYTAWKGLISTTVGPDAARAGRLYLRRRTAREEKRRLREKREATMSSKFKWASAVIHDATSCVARRGMVPWRRYVTECRVRRERAERMGWHSIATRCFGQWREIVTRRKR